MAGKSGKPRGGKKPAKQAIQGVSSRSGTAPPAEHQWKPGQSGNPTGRKSALATMQDWFNIMQDWPYERLAKVSADPATPAAQATAAKIWMGAITEGGADFDRICDRTGGKPHQASTVKVEGEKVDPVHSAMAALVGDAEALAAARLIAKKLDSRRDDG